MSVVVVGEDNSIALPAWVIEELGLVEGDEIAFIKAPDIAGYHLRKVRSDVAESEDERNNS